MGLKLESRVEDGGCGGNIQPGARQPGLWVGHHQHSGDRDPEGIPGLKQQPHCSGTCWAAPLIQEARGLLESAENWGLSPPSRPLAFPGSLKAQEETEEEEEEEEEVEEEKEEEEVSPVPTPSTSSCSLAARGCCSSSPYGPWCPAWCC